MYKKTLLALGIILTSAAILFAVRNTSLIEEAVLPQEKATFTAQETLSKSAEATAVDEKDNPKATLPTTPAREYTLSIDGETTVLAAMEALSASSAFTFAGQEFPGLGFFVEEIGGLKNADGFYWTLFIDGKPSALGVSSARVTPSNHVEWRYQKGL